MSVLHVSTSTQGLPTVTTPAVLRRVFSFPVCLAVLLVGGVFLCARLNPPDPDTWWHIAVGDRILRQGVWPTADSYSFTASGSPWVAYEWLGEIVMAVAARVGGLSGQVGLLIVLSSLFFLLLYYLCYLRTGNVKAAFAACSVLLPLAAFFFTLRPQLMGYIFLLLTLVCLRGLRQGRDESLWVLPLVFLLWVNTHGSFAFGLLALGVYGLSGLFEFRVGGVFAERWTREQRRHLALVSLLSVAALAATPYGTRLAAYPLELALFQHVNVASIIEWQPLAADPLMGRMFMVLLLSLLLALAIFRPTYRVEEVVLLLFAIYAASVHRRFLALVVIFLAPLLAVLFARVLKGYRPSKDRPLLNAALMFLIGISFPLLFPREAALQQRVTENYPAEAIEYLVRNPPTGPMLNEYGWGGYLIWARGPGHKVFIDGRADIYDYSGVLADYMSITLLKPKSLELLDKYNVQTCLLRRDAPLATVLAALPGWQLVYADPVSALFAREPARSAGEISVGQVPELTQDDWPPPFSRIVLRSSPDDRRR